MSTGTWTLDAAAASPAVPSMHGHRRRLARILRRGTKKLVLAPVDDSLLAGPFDGLESVGNRLSQFMDGPDAVVGFRLASSHLAERAPHVPFVLNLTASTTQGIHVEKCRVGSVTDAVAVDAAAVAVHVNFSSRFESTQLAMLGDVSNTAGALGMPLMGILYPRREVDGRDDNYDRLRRESPDTWTDMVCHVTRVGAELGCSIIKTQWTGSAASFERVVRAGEGAMVVIAGGKPRDPRDFVSMIEAVLASGAAGVSFGRNFFNRVDSRPWIGAAAALVHHGENPKEVLRWLTSSQAGA